MSKVCEMRTVFQTSTALESKLMQPALYVVAATPGSGKTSTFPVSRFGVRKLTARCAVDFEGATVEFFLSAFRDVEAAKSLFRRALRDRAHPQPRVINTDLAPTYPRRWPS